MISFNIHSDSGIDIIIIVIPTSQMEDRDLGEDESLDPNHTAHKGLRFKAGQPSSRTCAFQVTLQKILCGGKEGTGGTLQRPAKGFC